MAITASILVISTVLYVFASICTPRQLNSLTDASTEAYSETSTTETATSTIPEETFQQIVDIIISTEYQTETTTEITTEYETETTTEYVEPTTQEQTEAPTQPPKKPVTQKPTKKYDIDTLARICSFEAPTQGIDGMTLIACVILNRVDSPRYPNTVREVVLAPNQFAPTKRADFWTRPVPQEAYIAANCAINNVNNVRVMMDGVYWFISSGRKFGSWANKLTLVYSCYGHDFYKE